MSKIFERLLQDFKRANTAAKEKMAAKFGYETVEEFEKAILKQIGNEAAVMKGSPRRTGSRKTKVIERITVHNVHILDASGSMNGEKIKAAVYGINQEIEDMKKDTSTEVTQTIVHFSYPHDIQTYCWKSLLGNVHPFSTDARGSTALLETIGQTLTKLLGEANGKDKYLIKIFTDGEENATVRNSEWHNPKNVAALIKQCEEKGFTITFVGTESDIAQVVRLLKIDKSNTLAHQNTPDSIGATYLMSSGATSKYRVAASRGEDVRKNFFTKKTGTL